jgi:hypothetical protein
MGDDKRMVVRQRPDRPHTLFEAISRLLSGVTSQRSRGLFGDGSSVGTVLGGCSILRIISRATLALGQSSPQ